MEALEEILVFIINYSDSQTSSNIVYYIKFLSLHYSNILEVIRITVPCVLLSMTLFCLLASSSKVTE